MKKNRNANETYLSNKIVKDNRVSKSCSNCVSTLKCAALSFHLHFLYFSHLELNIFRLSFKLNEERKMMRKC